MPSQVEVLSNVQELLGRPSGGQVHFSDVFPEVAGEEEMAWWEKTDFDAPLTVLEESYGITSLTTVPIGLRPWLADYGLVLLDDLVRSAQNRVSGHIGSNSMHIDAYKEKARQQQATLAVANYAPRDEASSGHDANGTDFYLAITTSGLEIYVTPLSFLSGLSKRNRIRALYRIPTPDHPEFDGDAEQFRSARIVRSRRHLEHLVPVYQYPDSTTLTVAKLTGAHKEIIPEDKRSGRISFVDKFGNIKLEEPEINRLGDLAIGSEVDLVVVQDGRTYTLPVHVAKNLHSAPLDALVVYRNCSDRTTNGENVGFVELMARVNGNPSTSRKTAMYQLLHSIPDLNIARAEVKIVLQGAA